MNHVNLFQLIELHADNNGKPVLNIGDSVVYTPGHDSCDGKTLQEFKNYLSIWYNFQHDIAEIYPSGTCHYVITGVREVLN